MKKVIYDPFMKMYELQKRAEDFTLAGWRRVPAILPKGKVCAVDIDTAKKKSKESDNDDKFFIETCRQMFSPGLSGFYIKGE